MNREVSERAVIILPQRILAVNYLSLSQLANLT